MSQLLTLRQIALLARGFALVKVIGVSALSDHEAALLREAGELFLKHGAAAPITELQWPVIEAAIDALMTEAKLLLAAQPVGRVA